MSTLDTPFGCVTCKADPTHLHVDHLSSDESVAIDHILERHLDRIDDQTLVALVPGKERRGYLLGLTVQLRESDVTLDDLTKSLHCAAHKPDGADELCQSCRPRATDQNHPPGMIFVGWGHGWQPCSSCGGSGLEIPAPYRCTTPMCGESGVCEECRKRGAR